MDATNQDNNATSWCNDIGDLMQDCNKSSAFTTGRKKQGNNAILLCNNIDDCKAAVRPVR